MRELAPLPAVGDPYVVVSPAVSDWLPAAPGVPLSSLVWVGGGVAALGLVVGAWPLLLVGALIVAWGWTHPPLRGVPHPWREPDAFRSWQVEQIQRRLTQRCAPRPATRPLESQSERRLCAALECRGLVVHRQQELPNRYGPAFWYRADLACYEPTVGFRLAIEVDGSFKDRDADRQRRLGNRDRWFVERGWHVLRFQARDCWERPDACADQVQTYIRGAVETHRHALAERGIVVPQGSPDGHARPGVLSGNVATFLPERSWAEPSLGREILRSAPVGKLARWAALGAVGLLGLVLLGAILTPVVGSAAIPLALLLVLGVVLKEEPKRRRRRRR